MVERYGDRALIEVNTRIEELNAQEQQAAKALWIGIRKEIEWLNQHVDGSTLH